MRGYEKAVRLEGILAPPEWGSLEDRPALRHVVRLLYDQAARFSEEVRLSIVRTDRPPSLFPYPTVARAVEQAPCTPLVATDEELGHEAVRAAVASLQ